jgi:hypothetical protein
LRRRLFEVGKDHRLANCVLAGEGGRFVTILDDKNEKPYFEIRISIVGGLRGFAEGSRREYDSRKNFNSIPSLQKESRCFDVKAASPKEEPK